uniref:Uncharacterized protein n=1 Tax=Podarcis muralis TaxID=64176 RepID=A0A670JV92_PODMU
MTITWTCFRFLPREFGNICSQLNAQIKDPGTISQDTCPAQICYFSPSPPPPFLPPSIGILYLLEHGEEYVFTLPCAYARSILNGVPWVELGGKVSILCAKSGYSLQSHSTQAFLWGKSTQVRKLLFRQLLFFFSKDCSVGEKIKY